MPDLLVVGGSSSHRGGAEIFVERALEILRRRGGWKVDLLKTNSAFLKPSTLPDYVGSLASLVFRRRTADCAWVQYGSLPDLSFVVLAKLRGYRVVVTPHLGGSARSQSSSWLRRLGHAALRRADRLALISTSQEEELDLSGIGKVHIRTFLPEESLSGTRPPVADDTPLRLVHAAALLSESKGSFLVVDLCAELERADVPFTAEIIGSAEPEVMRQVEERIASLGLSGRLRLLGPRTVPEVMEHLRRSDVLIHLSRKDSYPLIVLEASACSALPVCLDLPGTRDMVERYGGFLVGHDDTARKAADLLRKTEIGEIRRRGEEAARKVRAELDWSRSGDALDAALQDWAPAGRERQPPRRTFSG